MLVIGLTGGIATGKSTASRAFRAQGVPVVDADEIAHKILEPGEVSYRLVLKHFGDEVLQAGSDAIDRGKLGGLIFNDSKKRQLLNRCTHPYVRRRIVGELLRHFVRGHAVCVVDVPLLFESGLHRFCGKTLVVSCSDEQQIARLVARNGFSRQEAEARAAAQMPLADKERRATRVLDNSGSPDSLAEQVREVLAEWTPSPLRTLGTLLAPVGLVASLPFVRSSVLGLGALCVCTAWVAGSIAGVI
ncbi:Dephospho-CoA kinase [Coemansia nantahalensis]|uniref:Dephospho-CoA kinase cab5 n=1 Tax=Coemansia helicoidea TaxID=1286919 RepID=A0ACC1KVM9_9FUNG|nr:Dephospho-CoA kinase [Coemansia nantahalensis]KAJ2795958.1 Dephospho-CoA kinase cab5 [Coemansia helicoidea]